MRAYDTALSRAERKLTRLGQELERPVNDEMYLRVVLALGKRARSLFRGFVRLHRTDAPVAAFVLLRPAVDINLVLRFLSQNPDLHTQLWEAEGELETLKLIREAERDRELFAKTGWPAFPATVMEERHRDVERARAAGIVAGVKGVSKEAGKRVFPSMATIAREHGDLATREAYTLAYRSLSQLIHTSSRAFDDGAYRRAGRGRVSFSELRDPEHTIRRHRALNVTTFASTLTLMSGPLDLDIEEQAANVRELFLSGDLEK